MDVCIVTSEIVGPAGSGGIGTASTALAKQLVSEGHQVTILFTQVWNGQPYTASTSWSNWVEQYRTLGISLTHIPHQGDYADWQTKSWLVLQFLKERTFDLVYFNEHHASGYYALCAKRAKIAPLVNQTYCVITHGSIEWVLRHNDQYMRRPSDLIMIGMERRCVEWADFVLSPSEYLLQEYARYGWQIPDKAYVHPYPLIRDAVPSSEQSLPIDELVFLGRLETRKGLWLFCDAIERIAESLRGRTVTFMGRMAETAGVSVGAPLVARAAHWPFAARFATWFSTREALEYLQRPGKLAVMPSLADNSPCVVYECIDKRIPFIATLGSGAEELIAPERRSDVLVAPAVVPLAEKLEAVLTHGAKLGALAFQPAQALGSWRAWHNWLSAERDRKSQAAAAGLPAPGTAPAGDPVLVNVMIDNGDCDLATLLANLRRQSRSLGLTAGHLVLTSRGGDFRNILSSLLEDMAEPNDAPVLVCGIEELQQARDILLDADVAFFSGAEYLVDLSFFVRSTALLTSGAASAVSCLVAQTTGEGGSLELPGAELPCGDLPAAAAIQSPLASPVWAIFVPALRQQLESLAIHDETFAQFLTSDTLGQRLIHRCLLDQKSYLLLPMVGAHRTSAKRPEATHWYRDLGWIAREMGFRTQIYPDAAPWFAMSSLGNIAVRNGGHSASWSSLPARLSEQLQTDPALPPAERARELASRIGRPYLAAQLSVASGLSRSLVDKLAPAAERARSERRRTDLLQLLLEATRLQERAAEPTGLSHQLGLSRSSPAGLGARQTGEGPPTVMRIQDPRASTAFALVIGRGLQLLEVDETLICRSRGSSSRLMLIDVPLDRQERLSIVAGPADASAVEWSLKLVDQLQGTVLVQQNFHCAGARDQLSIPLPAMLGLLAIEIDIRSGSAGLKIESLKMA
jgi:glycosyltransferase involved in cell wall biosynthesis